MHTNDIPDRPLTVVPVELEVAQAIRAFHEDFPNLGAHAVLSEARRSFPDLTLDQVRTVLAGQA